MSQKNVANFRVLESAFPVSKIICLYKTYRKVWVCKNMNDVAHSKAQQLTLQFCNIFMRNRDVGMLQMVGYDNVDLLQFCFGKYQMLLFWPVSFMCVKILSVE